MRLPIEEWGKAHLPHEAGATLDEALIAFRAGAYRAALLFSYISFGLLLRSRLMKASLPPNIPQGQWNDLKHRLQKEDSWDKAVFEATQQYQSPAPIFMLSQDQRSQMLYWKDRRNDCAHQKKNEIAAAHVEAFWMFIISNARRFAPVGTRDDLVERIREHFDSNLTSPTASCDELARECLSSVLASELDEFLGQIVTLLSYTSIQNTKPTPKREVAKFFDALIRMATPSQQELLGAYLKRELEVFCKLLSSNPNHVQLVIDDSKVVRQLWRQKLKEIDKRLRLYSTLLRLGALPPEDLNEANQYVLRSKPGVPHNDDHAVLAANGFFEKVKKQAFEVGQVNDFGWGNGNASLVRYFIKTHTIDSTVAGALSRHFCAEPFPNTVRDELRTLFAEDQTKRAELEAACSQAGVEAPSPLLGATTA